MTRKNRPYTFYAMETAVCSTCLRRVEAKILLQERGDQEHVLLRKWCPQHGFETVLLADDAAYWRRARERFLKPPEMPGRFQTPMKWGCPYDCGLCPDHQQHACVTVVEITDQCNLRCPICYADSGPHRLQHRSLAEIEAMLDTVVASEGVADVVQISGGEPTIHPEFLRVLELARERPIRHLMVNTNGVRIAKDPELVEALAVHKKNFEIYLQFDSLRDAVHERIRGARLANVRQQALERLEEAGISTTLVVTLQRGVNDDEIGAIVDHALSFRCVRGVTFQPTQEAGRVEGYAADTHRLTLTEVRRRLIEATPFEAADIVPVPCHPEVLAMGYALKNPEGPSIQPLTGMIPEDVLIGGTANTIRFEGALRGELDALFSTGLGPEGQAGKLADVLCCLPRVELGELSYENVFRVMIVQFLDRRDLTVMNAKKSCVHFARPDGTLIPFDTFNTFYRDGRRARLEELRAAVERG